jgi:hypothetical protein
VHISALELRTLGSEILGSLQVLYGQDRNFSEAIDLKILDGSPEFINRLPLILLLGSKPKVWTSAFKYELQVQLINLILRLGIFRAGSCFGEAGPISQNMVAISPSRYETEQAGEACLFLGHHISHRFWLLPGLTDNCNHMGSYHRHQAARGAGVALTLFHSNMLYVFHTQNITIIVVTLC